MNIETGLAAAEPGFGPNKLTWESLRQINVSNSNIGVAAIVDDLTRISKEKIEGVPRGFCFVYLVLPGLTRGSKLMRAIGAAGFVTAKKGRVLLGYDACKGDVVAQAYAMIESLSKRNIYAYYDDVWD